MNSTTGKQQQQFLYKNNNFITTTTGYNTNLWFHPQISLGYLRQVETIIITEITKNKKSTAKQYLLE